MQTIDAIRAALQDAAQANIRRAYHGMPANAAFRIEERARMLAEHDDALRNALEKRQDKRYSYLLKWCASGPHLHRMRERNGLCYVEELAGTRWIAASFGIIGHGPTLSLDAWRHYCETRQSWEKGA